jgi:hypothetical protein
MRRLDRQFIQDLQGGALSPLLERVKSDETLDLQIRESALNLYYRGSSLVRVETRPSGTYGFLIEPRYGDFPGAPALGVRKEERVGTARECLAWLQHVPVLKDAMDRYRTLRKNGWEREAQQLLVRDNNRGKVGRSTDYFICDVEYSQPGREFSFDAVALKWPSRAAERKWTDDLRLALVAVRFGDGTLEGAASLSKYARDADAMASEVGKFGRLGQEMVALFVQKHELGLIDCDRVPTSVSHEPPELLLVLANHDPDSTLLADELEKMRGLSHVELRLASASLFGYGLYETRLMTVDQFLAPPPVR